MSDKDYLDDRRYERLDGVEVLMSPSPSWKHNNVVDNIVTSFNTQLKGKPCRASSVSSLYMSKKDQPIPDIMVLCKRSDVIDGRVSGVPALIIEVLSPGTTKKDRGYKMKLYGGYGVLEYWLVDPFKFEIEVYLLKENSYELIEVYNYYITDEETGEDVQSNVVVAVTSLPGLNISLAEVFDDDWGE